MSIKKAFKIYFMLPVMQAEYSQNAGVNKGWLELGIKQ